MGKKIKNTITPLPTAFDAKAINSILYGEFDFIVDFSFEGAFTSCKTGDFNNFLTDEKEFILKFRDMMKDVARLSGHKLKDLINGGEYRHCHKIAESDVQRAKEIIKAIFSQLNKDDSYYEQLINCEDIYQIGFQSEVRLFGTIQGNVFRVYYIDYYHDFNYDQRRNNRNKRLCKFCPSTSEL